MVCRSVISEAKALLQDGFRETLAPFDELEAYWATILQDFPNHPLCSKPETWSKTVPLLLWGDEGQVRKKSWMVSTWCLDLNVMALKSNSLKILFLVLGDTEV